MQNFLKNLFGKRKRSAEPPCGKEGPPAHLLQELETKVNQLLPFLEGPDQLKLQKVLQGFKDDNLKAVVDAFISFNQTNRHSPDLQNMGILIAAQTNHLLIQEKDGLLDKQMVLQRKSAVLKSLLGFLGNAYEILAKS